MNIICLIFRHQWHYLEAKYAGDFSGMWCERCDKHIGVRCVDLVV